MTTTRRVDSGTWPLYLFCLVAIVAAGLIQWVTRTVPPSVANSTPTWYDAGFVILQPMGALVVLFALWYRPKRLVPTLHLERIGCVLNFTIGGFYTLAVAVNNGGPPTTAATWLVVGFSGYSLYRASEITRAFNVGAKGAGKWTLS